MDELKLEEVIIRYINDEASADEIDMLMNVVKSNEHKELLESYFLTDHFVHTELLSFDAKEAFNLFKDQVGEEEAILKISWLKRNRNVLKYAAVFTIGLCSVVYWAYFNTNGIEIANEITLELEDGSTRTIEEGGNQNIINAEGLFLGKQEDEKLVYDTRNNASLDDKLRYNKLIVPYGKRYQIELADGSQVHLNSGSTLRYPVRFPNNGSREVYLSGEAYFKVSKDKEHSFIVLTDEINTEVFGTEFNVSSYENDASAHVVLVEGSVGVSSNSLTDKNQMMLNPLDKAEIDKNNNRLTKATVNIETYISWKDGVLMFENERFETIIRKLERHFDVSISNNLEQINNNRYTGVFDIETLEEILEAFSSHRAFEYRLEGNNVIIDPSL